MKYKDLYRDLTLPARAGNLHPMTDLPPLQKDLTSSDRRVLLLVGIAVVVGALTAFGAFVLTARTLVIFAGTEPVLNRSAPHASLILELSSLAAIVSVLIAGAMLMMHARKKLLAEKTARDTAALLRSTVENITQGVLVFDKDSKVIAWNHQYLELRGLDHARMHVGMDIREIQEHATPMTLTVQGTDHDSRRTSPAFGDLTQPFDGEGMHADGRVLQISGRPAISGHYVVTASDITALKHSEAAFRDQATRLTSLLDNIVDAIVTINEGGSIESWSKGAERLFGHTADEVLHRNVAMLLPTPNVVPKDGYLSYFKTRERRDIEALHKSGHRIDVELSVSEMHIDSRRLFVAVLRDISGRLEVERLKSGFVSTVSHELRTPLTSIAGSLGLLAGTVADQLPPNGARLIEIAKQNCDRLVRLINDILDLEKTESGKMEFYFEEQQLAPILRLAIDMNRGYAESYGTTIELEKSSEDATVYVDKDRLSQVVTNLLSNAVKFSPRDGIVRVGARVEKKYIRITVQDDGPGIAQDFQKRIFQKFAQADSSDSRAKGGTGLGLAIAKTIIDRLGGTIGFDLDIAKGARFYVTLPTRIKGEAENSKTSLPSTAS